MKSYTKCNFCKYFVGKQCSAESVSGSIPKSYCRQAIWEFSQWKNSLKSGKKKGFK